MSAKKKAKPKVNELGYRVMGKPPIEAAVKALDRKAAAREVRDLIFGSSLPFTSRQRIAELLDMLAGASDDDE